MSGNVQKNPWFHIPHARENPRVRLFCFCYAGGSAQIFHDWPNYLSDQIEVYAIQLPGRGSRLLEEPLVSMDALVPELCSALESEIIVPFAFFGHSMGAQVAFELILRLREEGKSLPSMLLVSGRRAPQLKHRKKQIYDLPDEEFKRELVRLNGTPTEILEQPELMELLGPALRADFQLIETWRYQSRSPINIPIAAFGGIEDIDVSFSDLDAWSEQTESVFSVQMFQGDHFFLNTHKQELLTRIQYLLAPEQNTIV